MQILLVVNNPANWPLDLQGVQVVAARQYLCDESFSTLRNVRVFNLCRSWGYQTTGYYVSLLAEARGHKPIPDVTTIEDLKSSSLVRVIADDLDRLIQKSLRTVNGDKFTLSIYFGQTLTKRDQQLGLRLFGLFNAPLLRAEFDKRRDRWRLRSVRPIPASELPDRHRPAVVEAAETYFRRGQWTGPSSRPPRYHMAILVDPDQKHAASDAVALEKFARAAKRQQVGTELITRDDYGRLGEFDALFIRATTYMNHYTYRFARRADAEGLAVIDDPVSIARCTNKVYLAERLDGAKIPTPRTMILHRDNIDAVLEALGLPIVLKQPDSSFSKGVMKAKDEAAYREMARNLLDESDLVIAQQFLPTDYDWRVGVLDGKALYACRYFMARNHWQIYKHNDDGSVKDGDSDTLAVEDAPRRVVNTAVRAAKLIGDGLYGVDLKQVGSKVCVIEINDNPSIDANVEDQVLKDKLYDRVIESFVRRIERLRTAEPRPRRRAVDAGAV